MTDHFLWCEKYRPRTIDECILPEELKQTFHDYVKQGELPNLLLHGSAGVGKTTVARALCNEVGADYIFINGSDETGIDVLRTKIRSFASTICLTDAKKVVILDEADYLNPQSTQPALRAFIEEFADNCRFILTCNFKNRIIDPLHSRCAVIDFKIGSKQKIEIAGTFFKRVLEILKKENIDYDKQVIAELVQTYFPDYRRILNELQRYSVAGKIDEGIFVNIGEESYKTLFQLMKAKNFTEVRKWVALNLDGDTDRIMRQLYDQSHLFLEPQSIPQLILLLAEYNYKAAFVADQEINMSACFTEIMASCTFK